MARATTNPNSFVLLSCESPHNEETGGDKSLERAFQSLSLKQRLEAIQTAVASEDARLAFLPGAGAVYMAGCKYAVVEDRWMAIFTGEIENYSYLVKKYCLAEAGLDPQGQYLLETVRALSPLNDAQVVALLFKKLGPTFMSKLRGVFTFAVYDSNMGRVLAANDCNGSGSLWQGHVDDCLVVACNMEVPALQAVERTTIGAGEYKFGWRAAPIAYMASQQAVQTRCNEAMQAAMAALASASGPVPSSAPGAVPTSAIDRRRSNTMPRVTGSSAAWLSTSAGASSVSSAGPWHTPNVASSPASSQAGGSYVPPHRRSQQFGPSSTPFIPPAGKRGLSRNSTSSVSGTWRRSTSDATCRPPPKMTYRNPSATLRRPSASSVGCPAPHEPAPVTVASSVPCGSHLQAAMHLAGDDDEDCVATTMDSWRLAASSMLFQPARVDPRDVPSSQQQPVPSAPSDSDMDMVDACLSFRSNPIPIRASRDSRPSADHGPSDGAGAGTRCEDVPILVEKKEIQSSLESVLCSSSSSVAGAPQPSAPLMKPSSMTFPWCESDSSYGAGIPAEQHGSAAKASLARAECEPELHTSASDQSLLPSTAPMYIPAASSPECLEAKRLLDLAAHWCEAAADPPMACQSFPHPDTLTPASSSLAAARAAVQHDDSASASPDRTSGAEPASGAAQTKASCMTSSGSFSDALALLLRSRSAKHGAPASPTDAKQRSGLAVSSLGAALAASHDAPQDALADDSALHTAPQPKVAPGSSDSTGSLPEVQEDPMRSVNAGVAWQFGDRIIPASLLQELAGGSDALPDEQAALASLVYSSPCAVCIVDVRHIHHPIVHVNLLFERQTGYTAEEVLGKNCRFLQAKPSGKRTPSVTSVAVLRAIEMGRSYCGKLLNYHKDGTALWNQLSLVPVRSTKSLKVTHYIGMQNFTKVEPHVAAATAAQPVALTRGASHQCLMNLYDSDTCSVKLGKKSSSHMQLSALNPELASTAGLPACGALSILRS